MALFDACVDLNPHQIDAAAFALRNPLSNGVLFTTTPLQNSLLELFGRATVLDDRIFGDVNGFRSQFAANGSDINAPRERLEHFSQRTVRRQTVEYIRATPAERIRMVTRWN